MEQIIIGSKGAVNMPGIGWCWYYDNTNYDDTSFDYCLKKCNEQESIMLEEIYQRRITTASTGQPPSDSAS